MTVVAGQRIVNELSGEEIVFTRTGTETAGQRLSFDFLLHPGGQVAVEHIHPRREERIDIRSGTLLVRLDGIERTFHPGQTVVIPPMTPHRIMNDAQEEATAEVHFAPAGNVAEFLAEVFDLAESGHTDATGNLNLLQAAISTAGYFHDMALARPPLPAQRILLTTLRPVAYLLGYRRQYHSPSGEAANKEPA
jgi:mannose-6-phosphate isomerase-like protein (cupin superfamily)